MRIRQHQVEGRRLMSSNITTSPTALVSHLLQRLQMNRTQESSLRSSMHDPLPHLLLMVKSAIREMHSAPVITTARGHQSHNVRQQHYPTCRLSNRLTATGIL
jgi:hypothetical protein